jgi:hypothetical protein
MEMNYEDILHKQTKVEMRCLQCRNDLDVHLL